MAVAKKKKSRTTVRQANGGIQERRIVELRMLLCPFCLNTGELVDTASGVHGRCMKCKVRTPDKKTPRAAVVAWNTRGGRNMGMVK